jgi:hypothetical protein
VGLQGITAAGCTQVRSTLRFRLMETHFVLGLACRLALDMGLHLDHTQLEFSQEEVQTKSLIFSACILYDQ